MPISRHFLNWNQPVLPAAVDYLIDRYAQGAELDLSDVVLVFTGRRASRRTLELLVEKAAPRWPAFQPPRMVTFQHFPEMLYPQQRRLADDLTQLLVWKKAIAEVDAGELSAALPSTPDEDSIPSWFSLCQSLRAQHNELAEDGFEFDEVFVALSQMGNHAEANRWQALRRIQSEYLMQMDRLELWDRQVARLIAVQNEECTADFDVILIGTVDISRVVRQMLNQIADRVTALIHAPESGATLFDEYGCLNPEPWSQRLLNIPLEMTHIADGPAEQAQHVVRELSLLEDSRRADEISIGVADETLVPTILQSLSQAGAEGRWPVGMKVRDTRPWRLLNGIADHLGTAREGQVPDFASLSDLVRHPDVYRWVSSYVDKSRGTRRKSGDWLTELDRYRAAHLQRGPGLLLGPKARRDTVAAIIEGVDGLMATICPPSSGGVDMPNQSRRLRRVVPRQQQFTFDEPVEIVGQSVAQKLDSRRPLAVWVNGIVELLWSVYVDRVADETEQPRGVPEACAAFSEVAEALSSIPAAVVPSCTAQQAIQMVLQEVADRPIPPPANDQAIELLGWLELAMDDAPVLLLTGFNEGFVPESVTSDIFLPNSIRTKLGLRDNQRRYARDAYALKTIMHSREQIVLVAGRRDEQGNPQMPSRLWFAAAAQTLPERVRRFYVETSSTEAAVGTEPAADDLHASPYGTAATDFVIPAPAAVPGPPAEIAVTAFREYLNCPYRYLLKRELRLRPIEDEMLELSAAAFGSLVHDVLNAFGQSDYAHATTAAPIEDFLLRTLQSMAKRRFGRNRTATVSVQLQMIQNRLAAFAKWQAATCASGWRIQHTEEDLKHEHFQDARGRAVVLAGRVDRIDWHAGKQEYRVLDYKTSESAARPERTHVKNGEWVDLQLPLYRLLVQSLGIDQNIQLGYVSLPGDLTAVGIQIAEWTEADLHDATSVAREVAADILDLKIDRIAPGDKFRNAEFARVCQDTVINPAAPWLADWSGRPDAGSSRGA